MANHVTAKLDRMRKPQQFSVFPMSDGTIMVQSDKSIGRFYPDTRMGALSVKGNHFVHLNGALGAKAYEFPQAFVDECLKVLPTPGGTTSLAGGAVLVQNTIQIVE